MSTILAELIGGFIRWLIHGCKTRLKDELRGNLQATWGGSYEFENYIIGLATVAIIFGIIIRFIFPFFIQ